MKDFLLLNFSRLLKVKIDLRIMFFWTKQSIEYLFLLVEVLDGNMEIHNYILGYLFIFCRMQSCIFY